MSPSPEDPPTTMPPPQYHPGQRLSLHAQRCTVHYTGPLPPHAGLFLGVEWDCPTRGKHSGTHAGSRYFHCRSPAPTAASFLRPHQPWDAPRSFRQALEERYVAPPPPPPAPEPVFFAGTVVQPLGFDRVAARYARLRGIRVLGLAGARIAQLEPEERDAQPATHAATHAATDLPALCAAITDLDLSRNLFASLGAALAPARALRGLRTLTLDGNRMRVEDAALAPLGNVTGLGLSETLLTPAETSAALAAFPQLERLALRGNALRCAALLRLPPTLRSLDLGGNALEALGELAGLRAQCPQLRSLNLRGNRIASARGAAALPAALDDLDVSQNAIVAWDFVTRLAADGPPIRHLRIAGNPLYDGADAEGDTRALVIARLPCLRVLNHSAIAPAERLRAELHYLQHVGAAVAAAGPGVLAAHPRYGALCVAHGAPVAAAAAAKHDLAARLVRVRFVLAGGALVGVRRREWTRELPRGDSVYQVLGVVGEGVGRVPVGLRLVVEGGAGGVEMRAGTRTLGSFVEGGEARVRVEDCSATTP